MPRNCSVCSRSDRHLIDQAHHVGGLSQREIGRRFDIPKSNVIRHFSHAPASTTMTTAAALALVQPSGIPAPSPPCRVCPHPGRDEVERQLVLNVPTQTISDSQPDLGLKAIERHARECVPLILERTRALVTATSITRRMSELLDECEEFLGTAKEEKDLKAHGVALGRLTNAIELLGRLSGDLGAGGADDALVKSAKWRELRQILAEALAPHPEAFRAVVVALQRVGA